MQFAISSTHQQLLLARGRWVPPHLHLSFPLPAIFTFASQLGQLINRFPLCCPLQRRNKSKEDRIRAQREALEGKGECYGADCR